MNQIPEQTLPHCRICGGRTFCVLDMGHQPLANALVSLAQKDVKTYPLALIVCEECSAAQLKYFVDDKELYENYLYMTPESNMLEEHYHLIHKILKRKGYLNDSTHILEIGSNIGHLLAFLKPHVRSITGIDPAVNIARMANEQGIPTINAFFNEKTAQDILKKQGKKDIVIARHCFAHNQEPRRMLDGIEILLSENGVLLIENAYFLDTIKNFEFDQIYHEHMYFYTLRSLARMLKGSGLELIDVRHSPIHGGVMIFFIKFKSDEKAVSDTMKVYLKEEENMHDIGFYNDFVSRVENNKRELRKLIAQLRSGNKTIHAYGASAKATTLLNYYQISNDQVPFIVDCTKIKEGKYVPKANIKVINEETAAKNPPDYYLLTSWNYKDEIIRKIRSFGNHKSKFILPHPEVKII